jgi:hypothetical protein
MENSFLHKVGSLYFFPLQIHERNCMFSAGIYLLGCLIYWFWASGEVQPWARQPQSSIQNHEEEKKENYTFSNVVDIKDE